MTVPGAHPSLGPPAAGDEVATLLGSLERQRATFAWKGAGLDSKALAVTIGASAITLGGLIKHLAFVEDLKLTTMLLGHNLAPPWDAVDWENDAAWPWRSAAQDYPETLYELWRGAVLRSRASVSRAITQGGLDVRNQGPLARLPGLLMTLSQRVGIDLAGIGWWGVCYGWPSALCWP